MGPTASPLRDRLCCCLAAVGAFVAAQLACGTGPPPPVAGTSEFYAPALVAVPGGLVNVAGNNLIVRRVDLSIDTRLGAHAIGATYNSASRAWLWTFDVTYDGATFVDYSGAVLEVADLALGDAIPGTHWVVVDAATLKTKGGLVHEFGVEGRLAVVRWSSSAYPRLAMRSEIIAGALHTTRIEQCTSATSCTDVFTVGYDASGRAISILDRAGRVAQFGYDAKGRLASARDGLDNAMGWAGFRYEYAGTRLSAITNSEGERVEYAFGSRWVEARQVGEGDPVWRIAYSGKPRGLFRTVYADPLGHKTSFLWDSQRRVHEVRNALGELTILEWEGHRIVRQVRPEGIVTTWSYAGDDVAAILQPSGNLVRVAYEPNGVDRRSPRSRPILWIEDDLGPIRSRVYDAQGRLVATTNGAGETTTIGYGADEMIASVTAPWGIETSYSAYGEHGHPTVVQVANRQKTLVYDGVGNLIEGDDLRGDSGPGLGGIVSRHFDEDRNVSALVLSNLPWLGGGSQQTGTLVIEHRSDGRRTRILRPYGGDTEFLYDAVGRLTQRRERADSVWRTTTFERDALGRLIALERPNGMREETTYDPAGRVASRTLARSGGVESTASFTYTQGRVSTLLDSVHGAPESYAYDEAGRVSLVVFPDGEILALAYNLRGRPVEVSLAIPATGFARIFELSYDGADRERTVSDQGERILERVFQAGRLVSTRYGNGLERTYGYHPQFGSLSATVTRDDSGARVEDSHVLLAACVDSPLVGCDMEFSWTALGGAYEGFLLEPDPGSPWPDLDGAGRRVAYERLELKVPDHALLDRSYVYDELSNLVRAIDESAAGREAELFYNPERNRVLRIDDGGGVPIHEYAYDAGGFAIERDGVPLAWDAAGRLAAIGADVTLVWDTLGRPVSTTALGVGQRRLFGGVVEADAAGNPVAMDLGEVRVDLMTGERLYRHLDLRGNVRAVSNDQGEIIAHYIYGAYGVEVAHGSNEDAIRFARGRQIGDLVLLGRRLYDPVAARFLAPDPVYQLVNPYAYASGNPVWFWDPGGRAGRLIGGTAGQWATWIGLMAGLSVGGGQLQGAATLGTVAAALAVVEANGGFPWEGDKNFGDLLDLIGDPDAPQEQGSAGTGGGGLSSGLGFSVHSMASFAAISHDVGRSIPSGVRAGGSSEIASGLCSPMSRRFVPGARRLLVPLAIINVLLGLLVLRRNRRPDPRGGPRDSVTP